MCSISQTQEQWVLGLAETRAGRLSFAKLSICVLDFANTRVVGVWVRARRLSFAKLSICVLDFANTRAAGVWVRARRLGFAKLSIHVLNFANTRAAGAWVRARSSVFKTERNIHFWKLGTAAHPPHALVLPSVTVLGMAPRVLCWWLLIKAFDWSARSGLIVTKGLLKAFHNS